MTYVFILLTLKKMHSPEHGIGIIWKKVLEFQLLLLSVHLQCENFVSYK